MALSQITFLKGSGGLSRRATSEDGISGLLFYGTKPVGFGSDSVKQVFSITEAETFGITADNYPVEHYHISEFFRARPSGNLHVGIYPAPLEEAAHDFAEVATMQTATDRKIRQIGVYTTKAFVIGQVAALQVACSNAASDFGPLNAVLVADFSDITLSGLPNLRASNSQNVSVHIGQDGGNLGASLFASEGVSISALGYLIGTIAASNIQESVAWVGKFNIAADELDTLAFANGVAYRGVTTAQLDELDTKGYIFCQKQVGIGGSYFNASWTCATGDYDTIEKNRAIDKAIRGIRAALLPFISAPMYVNPTTGKLSEDTIQSLNANARRPILDMVTAGELSGGTAFIDPEQSVLEADEIQVVAALVPVGVARNIIVNIGFTTSISN